MRQQSQKPHDDFFDACNCTLVFRSQNIATDPTIQFAYNLALTHTSVFDASPPALSGKGVFYSGIKRGLSLVFGRSTLYFCNILQWIQRDPFYINLPPNVPKYSSNVNLNCTYLAHHCTGAKVTIRKDLRILFVGRVYHGSQFLADFK